LFYFFFQAEDGIRDRNVTGVQTCALPIDEAELGFTYAEVDELLYELIDNRVSREQLIQRGFKEDFLHKVIAKIQSSQFKRRGPVICKVSPRTVTHDFHYLRDWGL